MSIPFTRRDAPVVKVCGVTRPEDARWAVQQGAHLIGLVFDAASPRRVTPAQAGPILDVLPPAVGPVAVLVHPSMDLIAAVVDLGIRILQFSGHESPETVGTVRSRWPSLTILKAIHVGDVFDTRAAASYVGTVNGFVLDAYRPGRYGGTGTRFDWTRIHEWPYGPYLLAGGLSTDVLPEAWAWWRDHPPCIGFDLSSALEARPGIKDPMKVRAFFQVYGRLLHGRDGPSG